MPDAKREEKPPLDLDAVRDVLAEDGADIEDEDKEAAFSAGFEGEDDPAMVAAPATLDTGEEEKDKSAASPEPKVEPEPKKPEPVTDPKIAERLRKVEGKLGNVTDQLTRALADNEALRAEKPPTAEAIAAATKSNAEFEKFAAEFPEYAGALKEQIGNVEKSIGALPTAEAIDRAIVEAASAARQFAFVDIKHEGWQDTLQTDEFKEWLDETEADNKEIQALADSDAGKDASKLLDLYEKFQEDAESSGGDDDSESQQTQQQQRLDDAVAPTKPGRTSRRDNTPDAEEAFLEGFNGN